MSLNNRIAIRDKYEARGPIVDCQAMVHFKGGAHPGSTTDTIILEPENPQEGRLNELVAMSEVEEMVNSESCDCHVIVSLSYSSSSSSDYRHRVRLIIQFIRLVVLFIVYEQTDSTKQRFLICLFPWSPFWCILNKGPYAPYCL